MTAEPIALVPQWRAAQWVRRRIRRLREWRAERRAEPPDGEGGQKNL